MKMRFLLLAAACFLLSACVPYLVRDSPPARGQVVDARTHRPVVGARVILWYHPATSTVTDAQGHFFLAERRKLGSLLLIPHNVPGPERVEVRAEHYQPLRTELPFEPSGEPRALALALEPVRQPYP